MIVLVKQEELLSLLQEDLKAWMEVAGGPNLEAFEFDPNLADLQVLHSMGYYDNRDAWIAGVQVKKLRAYIDAFVEFPIKAAQNK